MSFKLSHSSVSMYNSCGYKWHMHYQKRLRETVKSAALHFGDCLDKTINSMLGDHQRNSIKPLSLYESLFMGFWQNVKVLQADGTEVVEPARTSLGIAYADSDYDRDLVLWSDFLSGGLVLDHYEELRKKRKESGARSLSKDEQAFMNEVNWSALKTKGLLMVGAYYEEVLPKIVKVYEFQTQVNLDDGEGNSVIGYVDAILDFGNGPVICDLKTSSMAYEWDSASKSEQLALYRHCLRDKYDTKDVCFIVAYKHIQKLRIKICSSCNFKAKDGSQHKTCYNEIDGSRCGSTWDEKLTLSAKINILPGVMDETFETMVVDNYDSVLRGIEHGIFTKNWQNCEAYGRPCAYYNVCRKGSDKKLVKAV